jgi:hypothetical protein
MLGFHANINGNEFLAQLNVHQLFPESTCKVYLNQCEYLQPFLAQKISRAWNPQEHQCEKQTSIPPVSMCHQYRLLSVLMSNQYRCHQYR